jgi:hypothetical protein
MNHHTLQATQIVERIASSWRGAPQVKVVGSPSYLPIIAPDDTRGMWRPGEAFIVSNTQSLDMVGGTLAHEVIAHHGLRETLGGNWRSFMNAVQSGARSGDGRLLCLRDHVRSIYNDEIFSLSPVAESDEIAAALVEYRFNSESGRLAIDQPMRQIMLAAKGHFSRETLYLDRPVDFDQLEGAILAAEHRLRYGGPWFGLGRRLKDWYAPPMPAPKPLDPYKPLMTLAESEDLLKADAYERQSREEWKTIGLFVLVVIGVIWILYSFGSLVLVILGSLFR